jgi:hypothetical protein
VPAIPSSKHDFFNANENQAKDHAEKKESLQNSAKTPLFAVEKKLNDNASISPEPTSDEASSFEESILPMRFLKRSSNSLFSIV